MLAGCKYSSSRPGVYLGILIVGHFRFMAASKVLGEETVNGSNSTMAEGTNGKKQ
jgi:hypothetical protein